MAGSAYKDVHDILKHSIGDIVPDGQIINLTQRICSSACSLTQIGVLDEFNKTHLNEIRDTIINRVGNTFDSSTELSTGSSPVDSGKLTKEN